MGKKPIIPFVFGRMVATPFFVNREEELNRLASNLSSSINTILISPRRWGKSSLVNKAVAQLMSENESIKVCTLDLFNIRTEKEFYECLSREVLKSTATKWEEWLTNGKNFLKNIVPRLSVGPDPFQDFSVSLDVKPTSKNIEEILMLPERIAKAKKIRIIICIDEFQNLSFYEKPLEFQKQLRASWQTQQHVCYCLFGSKRHMITDLFENKSMPFYKFGDLMFLEKIASEHWVPYIMRSFKKTGKSIERSAAEEIALSVQNHPYFVQQLAQKTWIMTTELANSNSVKEALDELLHENSILYLREVENMSNPQVNFLRAILDKIKQFSAASTLKKYGLGTSANVQKIKAALEQKEVLDFMGPYPEFIDPLFELWLKQIYFK
jgi:uncharacterized protein